MVHSPADNDDGRILRVLRHHGVAIYLSEIYLAREKLENRFGIRLGIGSLPLVDTLRRLVNAGEVVVYYDETENDIAFMPRGVWEKECNAIAGMETLRLPGDDVLTLFALAKFLVGKLSVSDDWEAGDWEVMLDTDTTDKVVIRRRRLTPA